MGRREIPHYTADQVRDTLQAALDLTAELAPPAELAPQVFAQAAAMLGQKTVQLEQPTPVPFDLGPLGVGR